MSSRWVLFGFSRAIGDVYDVIHSQGEHLSKIVLNVETDQQLINDLVSPLKPAVSVVHLEEFTPRPGERYSFGFFAPGKSALVERLQAAFGLRYDNLIHRRAEISSLAILGEGLLVNPFAVVAAYAQIGDHVRLNRSASIGHSTVVQAYAHVGPGATVAGYCSIGTNSFIGTGATIRNEIRIGKDVVVGAGSVVMKDIPDGATAVGNPARIVRMRPPSLDGAVSGVAGPLPRHPTRRE